MVRIHSLTLRLGSVRASAPAELLIERRPHSRREKVLAVRTHAVCMRPAHFGEIAAQVDEHVPAIKSQGGDEGGRWADE